MAPRITGEVLKVVDVEVDVELKNDYDKLYFRIELIADRIHEGRITARLLRKEFYRIQPTFPQEADVPKAEPSDEMVFVDDTHLLDLESVSSADWKVTLSRVISQLNNRFTPPRNR